MKKWAFIILYFILILNIGFVNAAYNYYNNSIEREYGAGEIIKGKVVMSFNNEPAESLLTSNFPGNISLLDFLKKNELEEERDYNCSIAGCGSSYNANNAIDKFNLKNESIIGFRMSGDGVVSVKSIGFNIKSKAPNSCYPQIYIDIGDKKEFYLINNKYIDKECSTKNQGCFNRTLQSYTNAIIGPTQYCMNVTLPIAPAYRVGGDIINSGQGSGNLKMQLRDPEDNSLIKECTLPKNTQNTESLSCIIEFASHEQKEYFLCIVQEGNGNYAIASETSFPVCGTDNGGLSYTRDYSLFAQSLQFDYVNMLVNDDILKNKYGKKLSDIANEYIEEMYLGGCLPNCIIPIKISGIEQEIDITNVKAEYREGGTSLETNEIYNLARAYPKVSSAPLYLSLDYADFTIPFDAKGDINLEFKINGADIFQALSIQVSPGLNFSIEPLVIAVGIPTKFNIKGVQNISEVEWDFGDGSSKEKSQGESPAHVYRNEGEYSISVKITKTDRTSFSKTFKIFVGNAQAASATLILKYENDLKNVSRQISNLPAWVSNTIRQKIGIASLQESVNILKSRLNASVENASEIVIALLALNIPEEIVIGYEGRVPTIAAGENINLGYLDSAEIREDISDEQRDYLRRGLVSWIYENFDSNIDFKIIYSKKGSVREDLATVFKINISPKKELSEEVNLFIDYPFGETIFMKEYGQRESSNLELGGSVVPINKAEIIEFFISEEIQATDLGVYLAPKNLNSIIEKVELAHPPSKKGGKAGIMILAVLIGVFIAYIALQEWYKRHYESYLFKDSADLYNVITFIYNARYSGLKDENIGEKLRLKKWSREQISYAFKKLDGKRTGMYEIPILKFLERRKVRKELSKRLQKQRDVRFIKRPYL